MHGPAVTVGVMVEVGMAVYSAGMGVMVESICVGAGFVGGRKAVGVD